MRMILLAATLALAGCASSSDWEASAPKPAVTKSDMDTVYVILCDDYRAQGPIPDSWAKTCATH